MGPYTLLLSLPTRTEGQGYHPRKKIKLQMLVCEFKSIVAVFTSNLCQNELAILPAQRNSRVT